MKKRILSMLVAATMAISMLAGCGGSGGSTAEAEKLEVLTQFGDISADQAEYPPNKDYDKYTLIEYYIEDADATVLATVSAKADESEYYMEYSFYGDDQLVICDHDGKVSEDKTGFMEATTPDMVKYIQEHAVWSAIPE